jgi:hypothetical protein
MPIGIFDLAHSLRKNSSSQGVPVQLGHAQQLVVAALGYKSLAAYQAAQKVGLEPDHLGDVGNVVLDYDLLDRRASELRIGLAPNYLYELMGTALRERAAHIRTHSSFDAFEDHIRAHVVKVVFENNRVNSEMANTNCAGVEEIYFDFEAEPGHVSIGSSLAIDLKGHVRLSIDTERPYSGHMINVEGTLGLERTGRQCFSSADCQVTNAEMDTGWADEYQDGEPPVISMAQAYADLLGLDLEEASQLTDVEPEPRAGQSGEMIYSYVLDFTDHASPEVAKKILQRNDSLLIEVGPDFFENVRYDGWPR